MKAIKRGVSLLNEWGRKTMLRCVARIPMPYLATCATCISTLFCVFSRSRRHRAEERIDTVRDVLGSDAIPVPQIKASAVLEHLLDMKAFFGDNEHPEWASIDAIAKQLADAIRTLRQASPQQPIVLSPFHYCSQYANVMVCDQVRHHLGMASLCLVSAIADDQYGSDDIRLPHIRRLRSHIDGKDASFSLMREMKRQGLVILFADAMPSSLAGSPMESISVTMFGRPARIQHGVFRLGKITDAKLLAFYLKFNEGRFEARIVEPIELGDTQAPQQLANAMSSAFEDNSGQWLPPSHPAFYYFSPEK